MKRRLLFVFSAFFMFTILHAQKAELVFDMLQLQQDKNVVSHDSYSESKAIIDYTFSESVGTFTSISTTGTSLGTGDDTALPLDLTGTYTFTYNMMPYSTFCVNTNGAIKLGTTTGFSTLTNDLASATNYPVIAAVWDDMVVSGGCYYQIDGSILTIEWNQTYRYGQTGNINFQVKLDNSTGDIMIIYDAMTAAGAWTSASASIGINDFENSAVVFWSVTPGTPATVSSTVSNNTIAPATLGGIATGTTYTFTAPEPLAHDLGVIGLSPSGSAPAGSITPQVTVFNYGSNDESTWSVNLTDGDTYSETVSDLSTITAGGSLVIDFPTWAPTAGTYTLQAHVMLTGDENADNDIMTQDVLIYQQGTPIFEQHDLITQSGAGTGGADISELQSALGMGTYGFGNQISASNSIADDFTVPAGETWTINGFNFYGYQTGSPTEPSTFTDVIIRVYDGDPSAGGSVIQDFWSTNSLVVSGWTGIYRVIDTDIAATNRPIMFLQCAVTEFSLTEGTYWVEWSTAGSGASGPWAPAVTIVGQTDTGNALQYTSSAAAWGPMLDNSTYPQGATFDIFGFITVEGAAPVTFVVNNTANTSFTGFALKGSWDAGGNYDATWMGGAEHTDFYDDGTHGDETAGDDIWTVMVNLMADGGTNTWEWGVNDQDGNWIDGNFQFTVPDETPQTLLYTTVGVKEVSEGISVYPNPANGIFSVKVDRSMKMEVIDLNGKLIQSGIVTGTSTVSLKQAGIYFLKFSNNEQNIIKRVIVK